MCFADFCVGTQLRVVSSEEVANAANWTEEAKLRLREFKQQAQPADAIYHYCSEQSEWDRGMGSEGWVIVRDGEIIDSFVLLMN